MKTDPHGPSRHVRAGEAVDIDLRHALFERGHRRVKVQPMVAVMMHILAVESPRAVPKTVLAGRMWGKAMPADPDSMIRVYATKARAALAEVGGWRLETVRGAWSLKAGRLALVKVGA